MLSNSLLETSRKAKRQRAMARIEKRRSGRNQHQCIIIAGRWQSRRRANRAGEISEIADRPAGEVSGGRTFQAYANIINKQGDRSMVSPSITYASLAGGGSRFLVSINNRHHASIISPSNS